MGKKDLDYIEKALKKILARQDVMFEHIGRLESRIAGEDIASSDVGRAEVIRFLDEYRANEALGAESLEAWVEVCEVPCLRGGLRTIQGREAMHAALLEARVEELGGQVTAETPKDLRKAVIKAAGSEKKSDYEKLSEFLAQFPDVDVALKPIYEMADRLEGDEETRSLLRTIAQDERATLEFLAEAKGLLGE